MHQLLARKYFTVLAPHGMIVPSDFQSMGFGLPAGIGAKLGSPEKTVVVLMGDGGFALSGMEILTAVREGIHLLVIVFNDGNLGLIRLGQLSSSGHSFATRLRNPDFAAFAGAVGARYQRLEGDPEAILRSCLRTPGLTMLEVGLKDSLGIGKLLMMGRLRDGVKRLVGSHQ
jgi:acetolactate synthase-1/2/3 large subunit